MMRNRSAAIGVGSSAAGAAAKSIHSPIQGNRSGKIYSKAYGSFSSNPLFHSKGFFALNGLVLIVLIVYLSGGMAGSSSDNNNNNLMNPSAVRRGQEGGKKQIVRDADGDIIEDDTLAKDIAAGRNIDADNGKEVEEIDVAANENRWEKSQTIPPWLKEYFTWHKEVTGQLTEENWRDQRYLVMTCLGGQVCGNVAHRLRPIMGLLRVAHDSKRIFYIHWDAPDKLEDYLHPPQHGGIDWIVPQFVMWKVRKSPIVNGVPVIHQQAMQEDRRIVNCMYNDDSFAEPYYNEKRLEGEVAASQAFKDVWNVLFKPSFMLMGRLKETLTLMGLEPGEYATAHIDYQMLPADDVEQQQLRLKVEQAMNCMSRLRPGGPFLVAAQTYAVAREALAYGKQHNVFIQAKQIAHDTATVPADLYTSFVELLLMASSRCVAFNRGGYGQLGYMLGYDYNCRVKYTQVTEECQWTDPPPPTQEQEEGHDHDHEEEAHNEKTA